MRSVKVGWWWKLLGPALLAACIAAAGTPARAVTDADGDGYPQAGDCDDRDESVWAVPGEVQDLHFTSKTTLVWSPRSNLDGTSEHYDTLRSSSPSVFSSSPTASCNDPDGLSTSTTDTAVPTAGHALYYLVRGRNACGSGSLGAASSGVPRAGLSCDCTALCNDGLSCTTDRCSDGVCVHDPVTTAVSLPPQSVAACPGEDAHFSVRGVPDGSTLHYQWKKNGSNVGTDSPALTLASVALADNGAQITCVVTGACPSTASAPATLTVFGTAASCAGGGSGYEAPNDASSLANPGEPDVGADGDFSLNNEGFRDFRSLGSVHLFSGEVHLEDTDLVIAGRGFDFVWGRSYRSRTGQLTPAGNNWDFTYDRHIVLSSGTVLVYGGYGRADAYAPSPTGCYTSPGFFRELCPQADGTWVLSFPNRAAWTFHALDGSAGQGRILSIRDPDLNTMTFSYNTAGQLTTVTDTLGRPITVAYNTDGYVSSITDFGGRQVAYHYYSTLDADGMPGDLASVTRPSVTGTPNGNDFPLGKTTTYTYTKNTGQPALDHNLLTVSAPTGADAGGPPAVLVRNVYSSTTNPANPGFDRLQSRVFADDPSTSVSYVIVATPPAEEPGAVRKAIVRDRLGNVSDSYFDASNRVVAVRQYSGRAPSLSLPTDATMNRPGTPLRPTDPPSYRTGFTYNTESLITSISLPKLDTVSFVYDSGSTDVKQHANLLQRVAAPGPAGADQASITESWTYTSGFGDEPCPSSSGCGDEGASSVRWFFANGPRQTTSRWSFPNGPRQTIPLDSVSGWTRRGMNSNVRSTALLGTDRTTRGMNSNVRSTTLLGVDRTTRGMNSNVRSTALLGVDRTGHGGGGGGGCGGMIGVEMDVDQPDMVSMSGVWRWSTYTDPNGRTWSQSVDPTTGHITQLTAPPVTIGQSSGSAQFLNDLWSYDTTGRVVSHTDPLGHVHTAAYFSSGPQKGYLQSVTVDAPGTLPGALSLTTIYARDQYGNATAVTDPNGNTETFVYNALDQVVRRVSAAPFSYTTDFRYDAAGNLARIDEDNRDENGAPRARPTVFTVVGHDPLKRPAYAIVDGPGALDPVGGLNLRTEFTYDGGGNLALVRYPTAVSGAQPHRTSRYFVDARGLPFQARVAEGDPSQSTTQYDYDADGGLTAVREGLESSPRVSTIVRDGYGRPVQSTDPMGNVTTLHYDASDNLLSSRLDGELTDGSGGPNVRLAESTTTYDEAGRPVQLDRAFFDTATGSPIDDGVSTTKTFYDERSQVVHTEDDNGHGPYLSYDGAGRLSASHDPVGNTVEYAYDGNGNAVTVTETEYSTNPGIPPQVTVTTHSFDALDRRLSTSQAGVSHSFVWDSRSERAVAAHDGRGNSTRYDYDDAGRLVGTHCTMTTDGTGSGSVSFVLDATRSHDDDSRLISQTDDNGNTTSYAYDARGRLTATTNPDGSVESSAYNVHDDLVAWTDPNGTVVTSTYDALGRLTGRSVARAPGVLGTTAETWKYDGLSRVVYAQNNDALVTRGYDSLSDTTLETSTVGASSGRNINWNFDGGGRLLSVTYPSGHNLGMSHDPSGRVVSITSTGPGVCSGGPPPHAFCASPAECGGGPCVPLSPVTTSYDYLGPDRVVHETLGNGAQADVSYDALRRVSHVTLHVTPLDAIDERAFTWDDDSNKLSRTILSSPGAGGGHAYSYDSASRMVHSVEERPGFPSVTVDYALDGANNRTSVTGGPDAGAYPMSSSVPEPADHQMNQYTSTPWDGARAYDKSGELVSRASGGSTLSYDYRGRLILVSGSSGSGSYAYDVFGRRVLADGKALYYDGMGEIEQRSSAGALERLSVHGAEDGEPLLAVADFNSDGVPDRVFPHTDDLGNVVLVMDEAGNPLERYDYGDYGRPRFFTPAGVSIPQSAIGNPFLFGGMRLDASTGLYDFRTRHLDPRAGRFVSRDTIGTWGDPGALGNASVYAGNNPWSSTDRTGTAEQPRSYLYSKFENGDIPDQNDFKDVIDSFLNFEDDGMTSGTARIQDTGGSARFGRPAINTALNGSRAKLLGGGGTLLSVWGSTNKPLGRLLGGGGPVRSVWASTNIGGARFGRPAINTALNVSSDFVAVPDRPNRRLVLVSGSSGSSSRLGKLCPGHISCPPLPASVLSGAGNPLGLSATRGIAVDCRL